MAVKTVVKSIGSAGGRNFSTLQAWQDAAPADLTTAETWSAGSFTGTFIQGETVTGVGLTAGEFLDSDQSSYVTFGITSGNTATLVTLTGSTSGATCIVSAKTFTGIIWQGQCYNDSEFVSASIQLTISGSTIDSTHYKELTAAAGQSFQDQPGVRSNALTYNVSNGVGIRSTNGYGNGSVDIEEDYFRCSRLQFKGDNGDTRTVGGNSFKTGLIFKDLIVYGAQFGQYASLGGKGLSSSTTLINVLFLNPQASAAVISSSGTGSLLLACTLVRLTSNSPAGHAIDQSYAGTNTFTMESCAVFGFADVSQSGAVASASKNNATDLASFPAGTANQTSVTFNATTPFVQAGTSGTDLRAITATPLASNGFLDATNAPNDISGFTRPANPTIGVWQLASAAVTTGRSYFL